MENMIVQTVLWLSAAAVLVLLLRRRKSRKLSH
jgi:hypothetical protein